MQDLENPIRQLEEAGAEPPTPAARLNQAILAVGRIYGEEWDREFLESARKLHADLIAAETARRLEVFKEHFSARCQKLMNLQERLCSDLVRLVMANRTAIGSDPLGWVRGAVEDYWATRRLGFLGWVAMGCNWADLEGWSAPGWLLDLIAEKNLKSRSIPYQLSDEQSSRLMPEPNTALILSWIQGLIEMYLSQAESRVLDKAEIELASEPSPTTSGQMPAQPAPLVGLKQEVARVRKSARTSDGEAVRPLDMPPGTTWEDLRITMEEHALHVKAKGKTADLTFQEAGFEEKRRGKVPDRLWALLRAFAMSGGVLRFDEPRMSGRVRVSLKQDISKLRKRLQALLPIEGDPFEIPRRIREYHSRFKISTSEGLLFPTPADATWDKVSILQVQPGVI